MSKDNSFTALSKKVKGKGSDPTKSHTVHRKVRDKDDLPRTLADSLKDTPTPKGSPILSDPQEDFSDHEVEKEVKDNLLLDHQIPAYSEQVKRALAALVAQVDLVYFSSQRIAVCTKKFDKTCILSCQHFGYCKAKSNTKDFIRNI